MVTAERIVTSAAEPAAPSLIARSPSLVIPPDAGGLVVFAQTGAIAAAA